MKEKNVRIFEEMKKYMEYKNAAMFHVITQFDSEHFMEMQPTYKKDIMTFLMSPENFQQSSSSLEISAKYLAHLLKQEKYFVFFQELYQKNLLDRINLLKDLMHQYCLCSFNVYDPVFKVKQLPKKEIEKVVQTRASSKRCEGIPIYPFIFQLLGRDLIILGFAQRKLWEKCFVEKGLPFNQHLPKYLEDSVGIIFEGFKWSFLFSIFSQMDMNCFSSFYYYIDIDARKRKDEEKATIQTTIKKPSLFFLNSAVIQIKEILFSSNYANMFQSMIHQVRQELENAKNHLKDFDSPKWLYQSSLIPLKPKKQWVTSRAVMLEQFIHCLEKYGIFYIKDLVYAMDKKQNTLKELQKFGAMEIDQYLKL